MTDVKHHPLWQGTINKIIRYYFYVQRGLMLFNEFRYLFMLIFGAYYTLKLTNYAWLVAMFFASIPVLILAGWSSVHKIGHVVDWLNIEFSTHWGRYQFKLLEELIDEIRETNGKPTKYKIPD